ncbi:hypothetical protein MKEN_01078700 [Mycena kentingensis (nom. inval.)]|nr:hypothetical protein MKEN_01078700 [Mycena kentingensis (nom. inval.)]
MPSFQGLKRLFSKKRTNKKALKQVVSNPLPIIRESAANDSAEIAATNLLRAGSLASTRFVIVDHNDLPPIPHPINHVLPTPASSTVSLASATNSINSTRGSYTVKVHPRRRHASTEFPYANRHLEEEDEPPHHRNNSQLLGLRSDPSVASLLDLYDEHGRLPNKAFSNSPPREGRAQVKRSGSTLRQLLGNPSSGTDSSILGDISWAEQFLGETESLASAASSPEISTPNTDAHFPLNAEHDSSASMPGISSLEVELSDIMETPPRTVLNASPYAVADPNTPRRASQIFGFLTQKRESGFVLDDERSLPDLPSEHSSPSSLESRPPPARNRSRSHFSSDSSSDSGEAAETSRPATPIETHSDTSSRPSNDVHVILPNGPTKVIVTAPTPSQHHDNLVQIPIRGPRTTKPVTHILRFRRVGIRGVA